MEHLRGGQTTLTEAELHRVAKHFVDPDYKVLENQTAALAELDKEHPGFARWRSRNTLAHKKPGYVAVTLSLKPTGVAPATSPTSSSTLSPTWPSVTASANCARRTSRTSSWPMSSRANCSPCGRTA